MSADDAAAGVPPKVCLTCVSFLHAEGQAAVRAHLKEKRDVPDMLDTMPSADRKQLGLCAQQRTRVCMPLGTCEKWSAR